MSVPTSEIPQDRQDRARERLDAATWGRLPSAIQDRLIRELDRASDAPTVIEAYQFVIDANRGFPEARFPDLREEEQSRLLDTLRLRPDPGHSLALRAFLDALVETSPADAVRARAVAVASRPLDANDLSDRDDRLMLRAYLLSEQRDRLFALDAVLRRDGFRSASAADQVRILEVLQATGRMGLLEIGLLVDTTRQPPDWSRLRRGEADMLSRDLPGRGTMLDHLHRIAAASALDSRVEVRASVRRYSDTGEFSQFASTRTVRGREVVFRNRDLRSDLAGFGELEDKALVLGALVGELASPSSHINQDNRGTCETTTVTHRLALFCPAEYARLSADLVLTGRSTLQDGSDLVPPDDAFPNDDSARSVTERLLQSAFMRYWRSGYRVRPGQDRNDLYRNVARTRPDPTNPSGAQQDGFRGSYDWHQDDRDAQRMVTAVFGRTYQVVRQHPITRLRQELRDHPGVPVFCCLDWGRTTRRQGNRRITSIAGHCIDVMIIRDDPSPSIVGFWNPWGAPDVAYVNGTPVLFADTSVGWDASRQSGRGAPTRWTVHSERGLQAMSLADLQRLIRCVIVPQ